MRTSARNQFSGTVRAIRRGVVNDEIELEVIGGLPIVATMTSDSRRELGLEVGKKAFALVAAASIIIMTERENAKLSARNQLTGTVSRFTPGAINSEVVLELSGGGALAAIITNESAKTLDLALGAVATGVFKASSVIIGVAA
jgi:molybdate transport system regulatory protein